MVKKQLSYYYLATFALFTIVSLLRGWYTSPIFIAFWFGGAVGAILPDIDHLIYVYFMRPQDVTSQRAMSLMEQKKIGATFNLLYRTQNERSKLIFHSALFQILFTVLAFLVITSSSSLFGRGLVLAFLLHLCIDQYFDLHRGNFMAWFNNFPLKLKTNEQQLYWLAAFSSILILALVF